MKLGDAPRKIPSRQRTHSQPLAYRPGQQYITLWQSHQTKMNTRDHLEKARKTKCFKIKDEQGTQILKENEGRKRQETLRTRIVEMID